MAHIYYMVRLIPQNHPYLLTKNIGRFGVYNVITEASRNLQFSLKHLDQIVIYFAMLAGIVMLVAQIAIVGYVLMVQPAMAFSWFDTPDPASDIAYNLLDRVFGVPDIFCSSSTPVNCTNYAVGNPFDAAGPATGAAVIPLPFHDALHELFRFYSTGLMLIATFIFLYFVFVIILETVTTGTPFGQRFQNVWAPIRLVIAIGLLLPITHGLNSGQYIVLHAAKYGSSFATNGWIGYNEATVSHALFGGSNPEDGNPLGEPYTYLGLPEPPDISPAVEAMSLVHACAYAYHRLHAGESNPTVPGNYSAINANYAEEGAAEGKYVIQPFFVKNKTAGMTAGAINGTALTGNPATRLHLDSFSTADWTDAMGFYYGGDIIIRFGEYKEASGQPVYTEDVGYVKPLCGDIRIPVLDLNDAGGAFGAAIPTANPPIPASGSRGGSDFMVYMYYTMVLNMWFYDPSMRQFARSFVFLKTVKNPLAADDVCNGSETAGPNLAGYPAPGSTEGFADTLAECQTVPATIEWRRNKMETYQTWTNATVSSAWYLYVTNALYSRMQDDIMSKGWGGAGIWYNKIAEINGGWMASVNGVPTFDNYPLIMEQIKQFKMQHVENVDPLLQYNPSVSAPSGKESPKQVSVGLGPDEVVRVGEPLAAVYEYWNKNTKDIDNLNRTKLQDIFRDGMHMLLGTTGLANMNGSNKHLHPLAQLVMVGKGLVDSAVFDMASSASTAFLGGLIGALQAYSGVSAALEAASQVFLSLAFMGLTAGFVLFYVLPFLPFVYFYFAVASWVKAIFEAMVGVPLWALAHLRVDGEGLPGDAAANGYFLILEIFIRPILTVVGLVAAITIFSAQVRLLNLIWKLVVTNASGFTTTVDITGEGPGTDIMFVRDIVDQFFFTVIYTIICYMLAMSSFKLIDKIPDNILRWAGAGVSSYGDIDQDNIESLNRYASVGGMTIGQEAAGAITSVSRGTGGAVGAEIKDFITPKK